jgi:hypothetical protein
MYGLLQLLVVVAKIDFGLPLPWTMLFAPTYVAAMYFIFAQFTRLHRRSWFKNGSESDILMFKVLTNAAIAGFGALELLVLSDWLGGRMHM